jgi:hypothetical protein
MWERYRGTSYLVFVDESFFEFFSLTARTGYFCHAAVGVPETEYAELSHELRPLREELAALTSLKELKHSAVRRLEPSVRRDTATRLRDALGAHGAFVAGFFTPVRAFVLETVRTQLYFDGIPELPEDPTELALQAACELRQALEGPGASSIIGQLLQVPVAGITSFLGAFDCPFRIHYDPRGQAEDRAVAERVREHVQVVDAYEALVEALKPGAGLFLGFDHSSSSEDELGIQLADLLAGEVKEFFLGFPELLEIGASRRLVTPTSRERLMTVIALEGQLLKSGALHRLPGTLLRRLFDGPPDGRSQLHVFLGLLASGMLTCYSSWGQPRHIMIFDGLVMDQLE